MKKILLGVIILFSKFLFAQDMITKTTGEDIKAKVLEVSTTEIKYYKFDMPNGPIYTILKSDVLIIRYQNGSKDIFQTSEKKLTNEVINNDKGAPVKESSLKEETLNKNKPKEKIVHNYKTIYGIKAGVNYSNMETICFNVGGFLEYKFNKLFSIQPELQFSQQGFFQTYEIRQNFDDPATLQKIKYDLYYINLPVLTKFNIDENINIVLGPQLGYLVNCKVGGINFPQNLRGVHYFDYSFDFGAGVNLNKTVIDIRYNFGFNKIFDLLSNKNRVLQLSIGYKF
jgi:hypothetical protein